MVPFKGGTGQWSFRARALGALPQATRSGLQPPQVSTNRRVTDELWRPEPNKHHGAYNLR